jgi:hypothetical protein
LIHARGSFAAPLTGLRLDRSDPDLFKSTARSRLDLRVPVLNVQSETDLMTLGSLASRQADTERFRFWEIAVPRRYLPDQRGVSGFGRD